MVREEIRISCIWNRISTFSSYIPYIGLRTGCVQLILGFITLAFMLFSLPRLRKIQRRSDLGQQVDFGQPNHMIGRNNWYRIIWRLLVLQLQQPVIIKNYVMLQMLLPKLTYQIDKVDTSVLTKIPAAATLTSHKD